MIPAVGVKAVYANERNGRQWESSRQVVAWDTDGNPMVMGHRHLESAGHLPGFLRLQEDDQPKSVLPGQGWTARLEYKDGEVVRVPVLGWLISELGHAYPLVQIDPTDPIIEPYGWSTGLVGVDVTVELVGVDVTVEAPEVST